MAQMHVSDFFHESRLQAKGVVAGIENANAGSIGQRAGVNPARPGFGTSLAQLSHDVLGQVFADCVERNKPQPDKIHQEVGIKLLGDAEAQMFSEFESMNFPRSCAFREGEMHR